MRQGRYVVSSTAGEEVRAFVPPPLPPDPPIELGPRAAHIDRANQNLGRLDGISTILPGTLFLRLYLQKEALLSAQIEGTQSSFSDVLLFEANQRPAAPGQDVEEVSNYVAAIQHGLRRMEEGFPLCLRLIREIHAILLRGGRGVDKQPGEFRTTQNWVGGDRPGRAAYVPPPAKEMNVALNQFERYLHQEDGLPLLARAALIHVQFETIHPFLDGNGRLGRLLITLMLCHAKAISSPLLYLSLYFKANRARYYDLLNRVRFEGAWEAWLDFFLAGVIEVADQATTTAKRILALFAADRQRIDSLGRTAPRALMVFEHLQRSPITTVSRAADATSLTFPTVSAAIQSFEEIGLLREITARKRDRVYQYTAYLGILSEGTEPLPR